MCLDGQEMTFGINYLVSSGILSPIAIANRGVIVRLDDVEYHIGADWCYPTFPVVP